MRRAFLLLLTVACASEQAKTTVDTAAVANTPAAAPAPATTPAGSTVTVRDATGRELGNLAISEVGAGLMVVGTLQGLAPGAHGIHFHATGKCEPPFTSAGGHWNPMGKQHGIDNPQGPHQGDLMNITAGADSSAAVNVTTPGGTLHGTNGLLDADGAALVVHAGPDDNRSDPAGNSGARIACGVVGG